MRRDKYPLLSGLLVLSLLAAGCQSFITPTASSPGTPVATATLPPSATDQPNPTALPTPIAGTLALAEPASGQTIVSPVIVRGQGTIPFERTLTAQVLDAQGGVLGQGAILFGPNGGFGQNGAFWGLLSFSTPRTAQLGSVVAVVRSPRAGDVQARDQVQLTLRGTTDTPLAGLKIESPAQGATVTSPLTITGSGVTQSSRVLPASVVDAQGNLLGQGTVQFPQSASLGQTAPFSGTVQFMAPSAGQAVFVMVEERSAPDDQVLARDAVQVTVQP